MTEHESSEPTGSNLPNDANTLKMVGDWGIYLSKTVDGIFVKTDDYHAGPLKLSREDLMGLVSAIDKSREEIRQEIISELETALKEILDKDKSREIFRDVRVKLELNGRS